MMKNNKVIKIILLVAVVLITATVVGLFVFRNNKNETVPEQKNNDEIVEKEVKSEKIVYVKINPLIKITYDEIYKICGTEICSEIESKIIKTEMLNEDAERIYANVNIEGMNIYNGIEKLVNIAKENGINTESISLYYDSENFDKKELVLEGNITINGSYTTILDEEILKKDTVIYTVTFNSDGGSSVPSQTIESGKSGVKPANPTKNGYTFEEWQLNGKSYNFDTAVTENITLKAVWKINKYTVTFNSDGGSSVASQTIESGKKATKPSNPTKDGYTFEEWQLNGKTYNFDTAVTGNITLKAVWNDNLWEIDSTGAVIKYKGTGESVVIPDKINGIIPISIKSGAFDVSGLSSITLSDSIVSIESEAITKRTSNILNVYITASQFDNNSWLKAIKGYSSMSIHRSQLGTFMYATLPGSSWTSAVYNKVGGYELSYGGNCGTLPISDYWYIKTEDYNLPNIDDVGYTFNGWTDENGGSPTKNFVISKGNTKKKSLYAHCDVNKWSFKLVYDEGTLDYSKVNYNKNPYCGSSINYCKYKYTDTVEIPYNQVIREGYTFIGWATTKTGTVTYNEGQKISRVVSQNNGELTLYARWKKD